MGLKVVLQWHWHLFRHSFWQISLLLFSMGFCFDYIWFSALVMNMVTEWLAFLTYNGYTIVFWKLKRYLAGLMILRHLFLHLDGHWCGESLGFDRSCMLHFNGSWLCSVSVKQLSPIGNRCIFIDVHHQAGAVRFFDFFLLIFVLNYLRPIEDDRLSRFILFVEHELLLALKRSNSRYCTTEYDLIYLIICV